MIGCFSRAVRRLIRDDRGVAITEFGIIAPVFLLFVMVVFDLAHMAYARSIFEGAVEKAARMSSLEVGDPDAADAMVEELIKPVLPGVELDPSRVSYYDVGDIQRPEEFDDDNDDNICNNGETYFDENGSGEWEADIGVEGNGGSNDVVVYSVSATYKPVFVVPFLPKAWSERKLQATTVKTNQPFGNQPPLSRTTKTCEDA